MSNRGPIQTIPGLIAKARKVHGDKYDYSLVEHSVTGKKVTIKCPEHGEFSQAWNAHVHAKRGCWECGVLKRQLSKRKGRGYWVDQAKEVHGNKYSYDGCALDTVHESVTLECEKHGKFTTNFSSHIYDAAGCPVCCKYVSKAEKQIGEYVKSLGVDIEVQNKSLLKGTELDIYIPSKKVAIELNGIYWHSTRAYRGELEDRNYKASQRHIEKHDAALRAGVRVIQFWEDEWRDRPDAVKSIIRAAVGVGDKYHARECSVSRIDKTLANSFLDTHHIQGGSKLGTCFYSLVYRGTIVAVMAFGVSTSIRGNKDVWELLRFATVGRVRGGGSKLLKAFETDHPTLPALVSYCDKRLFSGGSYIRYGFKESGVCRPDYTVVEYNKKPVRRHKTWAKKAALRRRYGLKEDNRTELEITDALGLGRVYDCGKIKFVKEYVR